MSVINLKGGVAKTTTTVQLAECLASEFGKKVLVIDLDPQTNATISLIGEDKWEEIDRKGQTLFHLFNDKLKNTSIFNIDKALQKGVSNLSLKSLSLLASSIRFIDIQDRIADISKETEHMISPMEVLKSSIYSAITSFDYVLIDCPPNLGFITKNGIEISDYYLIPSIPDYLSTYGIPQIVKNIHDFAGKRSLKIRCLGLLVTKYASNSESHRRGMETLPERFRKIFRELQIPPSTLFQTRIPQANATAEAMDFEGFPSTFREKYGRTKSGNRYLYEYVIDLTKEFVKRAES
ncbi:AAA family ATPase [Phormidium sp. FACHB-1136]|uniref:AAA family ATPase n=1 Tax=Phormidium sp. FACHB-1136 TaxID=2692848 RepID=UPI001684D72D|nr:AAA family ATPase [Phormidium sp. FACHB-1136]